MLVNDMIDNFLSKKQDDFLKADLKRINLLYGSVRSGKTWISLLKWALWIGEQPKDNEFIMVGKTITTLKRNCLELLKKLVGDNFNYSISSKEGMLFGHRVWLEGANDEKAEGKIRGMTLKGAYVDELTKIPRSFTLMLLGRLNVKGASLIATTNPDHKKHYVKTDIIDNKELNSAIWKFELDDNIHLDEDYKKNIIAEYKSMSIVFYKRFIKGEFVNAEGLVFPFISENIETLLIDDVDLAYYRWCEIGFDIGGNGSAHALVCTAELADGRIVVLKSRKLQAQDVAIEELTRYVADFVKEINLMYKIQPEFINCDHNNVVVNSLSNNIDVRCGLTYKPALEERVFLYNSLFSQRKIFFMKNNCDDLIDELSEMVYDDRKEKAIPKDDGTMQIDTYDAFTYSVAGNWNRLMKE